MQQVIVRAGRAEVIEVPAPAVRPGAVLVAVEASCISPGTELSGVRGSAEPFWRRALRRPDKAREALESLATHGVARTRALVQSKVRPGEATGYSAAGTVLEVGPGVDDLAVGERVACAGAQCAHHAETICVPRNLVAPIPDGLDTTHAASVTLGAIALQGLRRLEPTLGETFVVLGLGVLGQLTAQLLRANGCRVIGTDLDRGRLELAQRLGLDLPVHPDDDDPIEAVARLTEGAGADGVVVTAASASSAVISSAFQMCRRKGRVVLVGDVGLDLERGDLYAKELDLRISTSYGPGRYDRRYEEHGLDYPLGYVRWTENRNMVEYLRLLAAGRVQVEPLVRAAYPLERAGEAYADLAQPGLPLALLRYPERGAGSGRRVVPTPGVRRAPPGRVRLAVVGAGAFVGEIHLPNLAGSRTLALQAVVCRTGHRAALLAKQWGAARASTDVAEALGDPEVDAVLIGTRHDQHAALTLAALRAGKHVLVEKPLALTAAELAEVEAFYAEAGGQAPLLLTGFNRRFAPTAQRLRTLVESRRGPLILGYRMNAGALPADHWVYGPEGGGRNLGEACHIYDLFTFLTGSRVASVSAAAGRGANPTDELSATLTFEDGSLATLLYTASGNPAQAKERLEAFVDGRSYVLDDYRCLEEAGREAPLLRHRAGQEKGHFEELEAFGRAVQQGGWPIPLWQQLQASEVALRAEAQLRPGG